MNMTNIQAELDRIMAPTIARMVEKSACIAREFGFRFPTEYAFGFCSELKEDRNGVLHAYFYFRVDDFRYRFRMSSDKIVSDDGEFWNQLYRFAAEFVARYIDTNSLDPTEATAKEILEKLNAQSRKEIIQAANENAEKATFSRCLK